MRELLFGDVPVSEWSKGSELGASINSGNIDELRTVLATPDLESRYYLEAWLALRELGVSPTPEEGSRLFGVVFDVPIDGGLDTLAVYENGSARYINHGGAIIVYDGGIDSTTGLAKIIVELAHPLLQIAGVWEGARPALPPHTARISLLTAYGLHFGQGPEDGFFAQPPTVEVFKGATLLIQHLINLNSPPPKKKGFFRR